MPNVIKLRRCLPEVTKQKQADFQRLGAARLAAAVEACRLLKNLAGPNYVCDPADVEKILAPLHEAVNALDKAFRSRLFKLAGRRKACL